MRQLSIDRSCPFNFIIIAIMSIPWKFPAINREKKKIHPHICGSSHFFFLVSTRCPAIYIKFSRCYSRLIFFSIRHYSILLGIVHRPSPRTRLLSSGSIGWKLFRLRPMHQTISRINSNASRLLKNINVPVDKLYIFRGCNKNNVEATVSRHRILLKFRNNG